MATKLSSEDFLAGLLAALAKRHLGVLSIRGDRFDRASEAAYLELRSLAPENDIELRFFVKPHSKYGDSTVIRDAVARLAMWDMVSLDNPEYQDVRLKITPTYAETIFERLRVDPAIFDRIATTFVRAYDQPAGESAAG